MPTDFRDTREGGYTAMLDLDAFEATTPTDAGMPLSMLDDVGDAMLTPGDPSPAGRDPDTGDLAYVVPRSADWMHLPRADAAVLAALVSGAAAAGTLPLERARAEKLCRALAAHAFPLPLAEGTAHGALARAALERAVATGDAAAAQEALPISLRPDLSGS